MLNAVVDAKMAQQQHQAALVCAQRNLASWPDCDRPTVVTGSLERTTGAAATAADAAAATAVAAATSLKSCNIICAVYH